MTTKIPAHTQVLYDLCDVLDEKATTAKGRSQAYAIATKAMRMAVDLLPQSATRAIGAELVTKYKSLGATTKQAPADEFDMLGTKFAQACRDMATRPGGSKMQVLKGAENMIAQMSGQTGGAGGSLGDTEKVTKEARDDTFLGRPGMAESLAAQARAAQELHDALDPYRNGHKWW